jgi:protein TonB
MKVLGFIVLSLIVHFVAWTVVEQCATAPAQVHTPTTVQLTIKDLAPPPPAAAPSSKLVSASKKKSGRKVKSAKPQPQPAPVPAEAGGVIGGVAGGKIGGVVGGQGTLVSDNVDLSSDAQLIPDSLIKPSYTAEALEANISGSFTAHVFVDASGKATQAELDKAIGYGMDQRVIDAILKARFKPRRDRNGASLPGWTSIAIILQLN